MSTNVTVTDMFCGAGGSSIGVREAGAELRLGMNHWKLAIETHSSNFPDADHALCDISLADPRWYPRTTVLVAAPECTCHSVARGQRRKYGQRTMFEPDLADPAAERSRATAWDVVRFAEHHRYEIVIVENVTDLRKWELWDAWWQAMHLLGYDGQVVYLNSMFCHPTPQSRDRMYVVFWKKGNRAPDLDIRPLAWCQHCGSNVQAVQSWKPHVKLKAGRYRQQYVYCCPTCGNVVEPYYYCAANAIDWSLPAPRIGDRKRPLTERTLRRIQVGLERFGRQPVLVDVNYAHSDSRRSYPTTGPSPTQTANQSVGLAVPPFLLSVNHTTDRVRPVTDPSATIMPHTQPSLCVPPFVVSYYTGGGQAHSVEEALPTQDTRDRHGVVIPPNAYIVSYYNRDNDMAATPINAALPTQPTWALHHLAVPGEAAEGNLPAIEDCGFRMLQPHEIAAAMAFPADYVVLGNQRERIRQYGNAVTPPVMTELFKRCVATLG